MTVSNSSITDYDKSDHSYGEEDTKVLKTHNHYFPLASKEDADTYLNEMWHKLNPPVEVENLVRK